MALIVSAILPLRTVSVACGEFESCSTPHRQTGHASPSRSTALRDRSCSPPAPSRQRRAPGRWPKRSPQRVGGASAGTAAPAGRVGTPHRAPEREIEDLRAVIAAVGGSDVVVFGHSGGAVLTLLAARSGVPMSHLFVSEPVLRFGEDEPPADLADRLQARSTTTDQRKRCSRSSVRTSASAPPSSSSSVRVTPSQRWSVWRRPRCTTPG